MLLVLGIDAVYSEPLEAENKRQVGSTLETLLPQIWSSDSGKKKP